MFLHITGVSPLDGHRLRLEFNNGIVKDVDLSKQLRGEVFEPLREPVFFEKVFLNPDWPNGADFAPEFLYDLGTLHSTKDSPSGCAHIPAEAKAMEWTEDLLRSTESPRRLTTDS
jgi:hypothetical protein